MIRTIFHWKRLAAFAVFVVALSAWSWSGTLLATKPVAFAELAHYFESILRRTVVMYFPIYVVVAIADTLPLRGRRRLVALSLALVAGAALAVQLRCAVMPSQMLYTYGATRLPFCDAFPTLRSYVDFPVAWLTPLTTSAIVLVYVLGRRRDAQLAATLRATSSRQIEHRRQRIESEIEAMRSRVDPGVLLETLRDVRARYERDLEDGERALDSLIASLREAAGRPVAPAGGGG